MSTPDAYGPMLNTWLLATRLRDTISAWGPEYMHALERQMLEAEMEGIAELGESPELTVTVRSAAVWRPGEHTPLAVIWLAGISNPRQDPDSGIQLGDVQIGVFLICSGSDEEVNGNYVHRYAAVIREIVANHPTLDGICGGLRVVDEDYTRVSVEQRGRVIASADIELEATAVQIGRRPSGPPPGSQPRADPRPPWPLAPTVLHAAVRVGTIPPAEEESP